MTETSDKARVLIVDDDPTVRGLLHFLLDLDGFVVMGEASNGVEAIALASKERPDFVVLDYTMPVLNGELTAMAIKVHSPGSRIIAFSSGVDATPSWADAYVLKEDIQQVGALLQSFVGMPAAAWDHRSEHESP